MKVVAKKRTAFNGIVYAAGETIDMPKEAAERFAAYGIVDILRERKKVKKAETQEKFKDSVEVK